MCLQKLFEKLLQIGAKGYYKLGQLFYYKLGQGLLQIRAGIRNWGKVYYKLGQVLQIGANYYKLGHNKRALRFIYYDHESTYEELLLKAGKTTMNLYRLKVLCTEIYKSINKLNPLYRYFSATHNKSPIRTQHLNNLKVAHPNQTTFGTNSLKSLGPKVWNSLPGHLKCCDNLEAFKKMINNWDGEKCSCNGCRDT